MWIRTLITVVLAAASTHGALGVDYESNWTSLDARPVPQWWRNAKFGIFVHWGPYSVPAFAPTNEKSVYACYAEWYQGKLQAGQESFVDHHAKHYGGAPYGNFASEFKAENFNPDEWAAIFKKAGAKYAVLTSKHHDGYALWPSPESPYYNSVAVGSGRDLAGEFTTAMKAAGLRSGFYYSLLEYANPNYPTVTKDVEYDEHMSSRMKAWARHVNLPQLKELVENYKADIIWADGEWGHPWEAHLSNEFLAWLYNESSVRDTVVVNDRWGSGCRGKHGGHYTTEYALDGGDQEGLSDVHPWEECRGIGRSFGYNRFETSEHYMSREKCIETLVTIVSEGGNLLLNVGPTADGRIPAIMQDRLLAIGRWLEINGEAIYGTTIWGKRPRAMSKDRVYFTARGGLIYVIVFGDHERIRIPHTGQINAVALLGSDQSVNWQQEGNGVKLEVPAFRLSATPCEHALVFRLSR